MFGRFHQPVLAVLTDMVWDLCGAGVDDEIDTSGHWTGPCRRMRQEQMACWRMNSIQRVRDGA